MVTKLKLFTTFCLLQCVAITCFAASPVGYWKTIDDKTGQAKSILKVSNSGGQLYGTVVKLFPGALTVCAECSGNLKNKPILGMTVMYGLRQDAPNSNSWSGGKIMDPKTGSVYRCSLSVADDGKTMNVRGYIGVSLFGRTQTWIKVPGK